MFTVEEPLLLCNCVGIAAVPKVFTIEEQLISAVACVRERFLTDSVIVVGSVSEYINSSL